MTSEATEVSPLTLNRLSIYLRCLRQLQDEGFEHVSSQELGDRFRLSPAQIRRDLATFGDFGVRGVGYDIRHLAEKLSRLLKLNVCHSLVIVGMGNLGSALAGYFGFNDQSFRVVAGVDSDPQRVGKIECGLTIEPFERLSEVVRDTGAQIGVIAVPVAAAQSAYTSLASAGVRSILNFAPVLLREQEGVRLKNVDMRIHLEEVAYYLPSEDDPG